MKLALDNELFSTSLSGQENWLIWCRCYKTFYCHSMVILQFCVIKQHYLGNYCGTTVHYHGICVQCYKA
jgi:hypothetical protein